mmetsp:Transcript_43660/g.79648  ORF Transcript_43660/g.79648 Transcript_43660/m.79648 type:complete len:255 (+) Transcript_43660:906-1670(+)
MQLIGTLWKGLALSIAQLRIELAWVIKLWLLACGDEHLITDAICGTLDGPLQSSRWICLRWQRHTKCLLNTLPTVVEFALGTHEAPKLGSAGCLHSLAPTFRQPWHWLSEVDPNTSRPMRWRFWPTTCCWHLLLSPGFESFLVSALPPQASLSALVCVLLLLLVLQAFSSCCGWHRGTKLELELDLATALLHQLHLLHLLDLGFHLLDHGGGLDLIFINLLLLLCFSLCLLCRLKVERLAEELCVAMFKIPLQI